ncbi:unnamed protein product [Closterium sp. Naga37s-1]|nr:unnamed protein product [Closterium sp. Naga37s-1]
MVTDTPILNPSGQLVGVIGVSADIRDIKRKEGEIRALNAALERCGIKDLEQSSSRISQQSLVLERMVAELREARSEAESANRLKSQHDAAAAVYAAVGGAERHHGDDPQQPTRAAGHLDPSKIEAGELEMGTANSASLRASRTASSCSRCPPYLECRWRLCPAQCARLPSTASSPPPANLASSGYCSRMCHGLGWHAWRGVAWDVMWWHVVAWDVMWWHVVACGGMWWHDGTMGSIGGGSDGGNGGASGEAATGGMGEHQGRQRRGEWGSIGGGSDGGNGGASGEAATGGMGEHRGRQHRGEWGSNWGGSIGGNGVTGEAASGGMGQ